MTKGLTDIAIRNLRPGAKRREIPDPGARGLYLIVQPSGVRTFAVRYRYAGKPRKLTLQAGVSLAAARKACASAMHELEQGNDPGVAKRNRVEAQRRAAADTFAAITDEYLRREGHKIRTAEWRRKVLCRLILPVLGSRPIVEIRRSDIIRLLDGIEENNGPVMADRTLSVISRIFNWHAARSDEFRSPVVRGMTRVNARERARERTLTDNELRAVWKTAETFAKPFGPLVQFLLLTAARCGEAAGMTWGELSDGTWTLPAARNKVKVDLVRPLSAAAQRILAGLPRVVDCKFVFTSDGHRAFNNFSTMKAAFNQASGTTGWTLHDLRRTARSLMSRAGVLSDHAERCLGHVLPSIRATYDRHAYSAEKLQAYEKLAAQIEHIINPRPNVVPLVR
jgi:integrase